jgi:catechol 2,3-dioxygenase-like lactoylglutathione lyase family enzyme
MEQRISYITLGVRNLKESENFYSNLLGWKKTEESTGNIIFYKLNGLILALYPVEALASDAETVPGTRCFSNFTISHNTRTKAEVDEVMFKLEKHGVKVVREPETVFWGGYRGYISDPNGFMIEIVYNPKAELDEAGNIL